MKFEDYDIVPEIKKSLALLGFRRPTDIQYKAIPSILRGEDVLAIAHTGTGKTGAFAIPVLHILHKRKRPDRPDGVKCVVMAPTHELALQITGVFQEIGKYTDIKTYCVIGGVSQDPQIQKLEKGIDILVATPGRLFDLRSQGYLRLDRMEILIIDEADHMLDLGFLKDIQDLIRYLPKRRQTLFFSATINEYIKKLAYSLVVNPIRIQLSPKNPVAKTITHSVVFVEMDDKRFFLERLLNEHPGIKTLVFVRTKVRAERVCKALERVQIQSETIHSDKTQSERLEVMNRFKEGLVHVLIATDISARGIDIPNVDYVVNYDLPDQSENYVHRVGRTGRGNQRGNAVTFCSPEEKPILAEIEQYLGQPIHILEINKNDYQDTLEFTRDTNYDWQALIQQAEEHKEQRRKKKKRG